MTENISAAPPAHPGPPARHHMEDELRVPFWIVLAGVGAGAFWALAGVGVGAWLRGRSGPSRGRSGSTRGHHTACC